MSDELRAPYAPDLADDTVEPDELRDLADAVVSGRDWANVRLPRLSLRRVGLRLCRLTGAELAESTFADVTFDECRLDLGALRHARLERVVFRDCRLAECDFYGAALTDVLFERCELREATFSGCSVERVELRRCELDGLRGIEDLRGARIPWSDLPGNAALFAAALGLHVVD